VGGDWEFVLDLMEGYCASAADQVKKCRQGHVIDTHVEPSRLELNGILSRGECMASYDVSITWHPITYHVASV
jgi:hypothetical protein